MKKLIETVNKIILPIKIGAALFDSLSAAFTAFTDKWAVHFPDSLKQLETDDKAVK